MCENTLSVNGNLDRGRGGNFTPHPSCWFSLNNSETVKAATLHFAAFSYISLETFVPNFVILTQSQSPDIGQNSVSGISSFQISDKSLIKENCYYGNNNNMKFGPATKLDKKTVSNNFLIYGQFGAIWKPDSGRMAFKAS